MRDGLLPSSNIQFIQTTVFKTVEAASTNWQTEGLYDIMK